MKSSSFIKMITPPIYTVLYWDSDNDDISSPMVIGLFKRKSEAFDKIVLEVHQQDSDADLELTPRENILGGIIRQDIF